MLPLMSVKAITIGCDKGDLHRQLPHFKSKDPDTWRQEAEDMRTAGAKSQWLESGRP